MYSVCLTPIIILEWKLLIWKLQKNYTTELFQTIFKFVVVKNGCIPDVWPHQSYISILTQLQNDNNFVNLLSWADSTLWHQGALVKHCKELYKAEGISNAAEPGNSSHTRFYVSILLIISEGSDGSRAGYLEVWNSQAGGPPPEKFSKFNIKYGRF